MHELRRRRSDTEYTGHVLDACVDVFFERYGEYDVAALLAEVGIGRDDLVEDLTAFARRSSRRRRPDGVLAAQIRKRLEPFFRSAAVPELLAEARVG